MFWMQIVECCKIPQTGQNIYGKHTYIYGKHKCEYHQFVAGVEVNE